MRLFCAIEVPEEIRERLLAAQAELQVANLKKVEKENLHITLCFFGEVDETEVAELQSALSLVKFPPLPISISGIGAFPNLKFPNVLFAKAECAELTALVHSINDEIKKSGVAVQKEEKAFHAHVTLARIKGRADVSSFAQKYSTFDFGSFTAKEFVLKKSVLSGAGPKYETIARCPAL